MSSLPLPVCFSRPGLADLTFPVVCLVQVNKKGTLMLSGLLGIGVHENILWPDIPYVTDQHGSKNSYFCFCFVFIQLANYNCQ